MAKQELVTVFTATNEVEATIVKNALTAEGIRTVVEGARQAGEVGLLGLGECFASAAELSKDERLQLARRCACRIGRDGLARFACRDVDLVLNAESKRGIRML